MSLKNSEFKVTRWVKHAHYFAVRHLGGVIARLSGTFPFLSSLCTASILFLTLFPASCCCSFSGPCPGCQSSGMASGGFPFPLPWSAAARQVLGTKQGMGMVPMFTSVISPESLYIVTEKSKMVPKAPGKLFKGPKSSFCLFWKGTCNSLPLATAQRDVFSLYEATQCQLVGLHVLLPGDSHNTDYFPSSRQYGSVLLGACLLLWRCALFPLTILLLR